MDRPVIVLGGGGHAKVVVDTLLLCSAEVLGITDSDLEKKGWNVSGVPVIGTDEEILRYPPEKITLAVGLGSTKLPHARQKLYEDFKSKGYSFVSVIHPSAIISPDSIIGEGAQIMAGSVIQAGVILGQNTIVNTKVSVDHDCNIGDHSHLAPGTTLSGEVNIGIGVHIGSGATVIQGISIGDGSLVGAGSLVLSSLPPHCTAYGVPSKIINE